MVEGPALDLDAWREADPSEDLTVFCTRCGHPNRDDARFCAECGAPLQADATVCLTPVEGEDEAHDEFPFPHDELEPGQSLLLVKRGPNAGSTFLLEAGHTVGRPQHRQRGLPRRHHGLARARDLRAARTAAWFVRDVGSLNGTYVNGEQVDETKLASGDEVQIGKFKLVFFAAGE